MLRTSESEHATATISSPPMGEAMISASGFVAASTGDLVCFSHLRWDFVFQRPQHLLTRFSRERRVFYVEEPVIGAPQDHIGVSRREEGLYIITPHLTERPEAAEFPTRMRRLVDRLFASQRINQYQLWFYTPMALPFTNHLTPQLVVYDCMDELSGFVGAPPEMAQREMQLMSWADLVFTGGHSLFAAKSGCHPHVHAFPSSIDQHHFQQARVIRAQPPDQATIPHPRIGFFGVVDERFDVELIDGVARAHPEWQIIIIGPVVKIDPTSLPRHPNVHYLGQKSYAELPRYLAGWDVAIMPFAHNPSTRYISPTKTPEYLSAGCPVVSTSIADVVRPYGELGLVHIADGIPGFSTAIESAFHDRSHPEWKAAVDAFLQGNSWEKTWMEMCTLMDEAEAAKGFHSTTVDAAAVLAE